MLFYIYFFDLPSFELFVLWIKFCVRFFSCVFIVRSLFLFHFFFSPVVVFSMLLLLLLVVCSDVELCVLYAMSCCMLIHTYTEQIHTQRQLCVEVPVLSTVCDTHGWHNETNKVHKKNRNTLTLMHAIERSRKSVWSEWTTTTTAAAAVRAQEANIVRERRERE